MVFADDSAVPLIHSWAANTVLLTRWRRANERVRLGGLSTGSQNGDSWGGSVCPGDRKFPHGHLRHPNCTKIQSLRDEGLNSS